MIVLLVRRIISSLEDYYNTSALLYRNLKNLGNVFRKLTQYVLLSFSDHHIDHDRDGENEDIISTGNDIHAIRIGNEEPLLRDYCSLVAALVDFIFMIYDVALHFHVLTTGSVRTENTETHQIH